MGGNLGGESDSDRIHEDAMVLCQLLAARKQAHCVRGPLWNALARRLDEPLKAVAKGCRGELKRLSF